MKTIKKLDLKRETIKGLNVRAGIRTGAAHSRDVDMHTVLCEVQINVGMQDPGTPIIQSANAGASVHGLPTLPNPGPPAPGGLIATFGG